MKNPVTASGIVQDYNRRKIAPDKTATVTQGYLRMWLWCNSWVVELYLNNADGILRPGTVAITNHSAYINTYAPQEIADNVIVEQGYKTAAAAIGGLGGAAGTGKSKKRGSKEYYREIRKKRKTY
jgi:hypothetical protein